MAQYQVRGPGGRLYDVEAPTDATDAQIIGALRQRLAEETAPTTSAPPQEETDPLASYFEKYGREEEAGFGENILSGLSAGAIGLFETAALGAATLLDEGNETAARKVIQEAADAITPEGGDKESTTYKLAQGVGSILGFIPTVLLGPAALPAAAALGVGAAAGEASERAREAGATEEERSTAALMAAPVGLLEVTPLGRFAKALKMPVVGETIDNLSDTVVGGITDKIGAGAMREISDRIGNAAATGGLEGAQEAAAEIAQNLIQQGVYDPEQEILGGVGEALAIGGGAGAIVQALVDTFAGRRARTPDSETGVYAVPPRGEDDGPILQEGQEQGELFAPDESIVGPPEGRERKEKEGERGEQLDLLGAVEQRDERQGDLFGEPEPIGRAATPDPDEGESGEQLDMFGGGAQDRQLDLFTQDLGERLGLTPEQTQQAVNVGIDIELATDLGVSKQNIVKTTQQRAGEAQARQKELFDGRAPSADVVPRIEATPSDEQLLAQERELALAGDYEGAARKRTQRLEAGERRERIAKEADQQRRTEATLGQVAREDRLAKTGTEQARQIAEDRLQREDQLDAFPVDRAIAEQRDEPTRLTRPQQEEIEGLGTVEDAQAQREEANKRRQTEMFGPRGGVPRRAPASVPSPRAVAPETRQPTQEELLPREEPEQGELLGPRGGARRRADFEAQQPQRRPATATRDVSLEPKLVTKKVMSDLGIPAAAPVRKRIEGRDMSVPEDAQFVRSQLTDFSNNPNVTQGTKFKITKFLEGTPDGQMEMFDARQRVRPEAQAPEPQQVEGQADVESRQPEPETSRASVQASEPSPRRRQVEPEPERAVRATTPEPTRLEGTERDTTDVVDRERDERGALEEAPAKEKAPAKPKRKVTRRKTAETIQTVKPLPKAKTKTPPPPPSRKAPGPAESTTTPKEVKTKDTTKASPGVSKTKTKKKVTPQLVTERVASEADKKLRAAQEANLSEAMKTPIFFQQYNEAGRNIAQDSDKEAVAELLTDVRDPLDSGKSLKTPKNAARMYFGKHARIEDVIEVVAHDLSLGGIGQSGYQAQTQAQTDAQKTATSKRFGIDIDAVTTDIKNRIEESNKTEAEVLSKVAEELNIDVDTLTKAYKRGTWLQLDNVTGEQIDAYYRGQLNASNARAALRWMTDNLSPKAQKLLRQRSEVYAEQAVNVTNTTGVAEYLGDKAEKEQYIDMVAVQRARDAKTQKERDALDKATKGQIERGERDAKTDNLDKKTTRQIEKALTEDIEGYEEYIETKGFIQELLNKLPKNAVLASSVPVHPAIRDMLQAGNLNAALQAIAKTSANRQVRNAALKLASVVGDTKVEVIENLDEAGNFDPKTNTIRLDAEAGMNVHTVLHEMTHAAVSATLANKSHPVTKQLTKLFESTKDQLDTAYGATNLDEFVSEAMSNPEFRTKLASIVSKGDTFSALDRFTSAVMNFLRRLFGASTKPVSDGTVDRKLSELDRMIENIMAPAPESRNADILPLTKGSPKEIAEFANGVATSVNRSSRAIRDAVSRDGFATSVVNFLKSAGGQNADKLRRGFLMTLPSQALFVDVFGKLKITEGARMHELLEEQEGSINIANKQLDSTLNAIIKWQKGNKNKRKAFDDVVYESTLAKIDPTKSIDKYKGRETEYRAIKSLYDQLDAEGKALYVELRDSYKKQYEKLKNVINRRIDGMINETTGEPITEAERKTLKEKVFGKLLEQGRIEPYFPLTRKGDYWLEYSIESIGVDGEPTTEPVKRAFESKGQRNAAIAELTNDPTTVKINGDFKYETTDDKKKLNFSNAPPTSFVGQTLKILQNNKVDSKVQQEFLEMFIDTLPETAFAKSLKSREGTLGFDRDAVGAFRDKAYDLSRQVIRLEYAQKIRGQLSKIDEQINPESPELRIEGVSRTSLAKVIREETEARAEFAINPPNNFWARFARGANRFAFMGTLGFNVSSALVNLFQIPMVVVPFMAGKTSYKDAFRHTHAAMKFVFGSGTEESVMVGKRQNKTKGFMPSMDNYYTVMEDGTLTMRYDIELTDKQKEFAKEMLPLVQTSMQRGLLNRSFFFDSLGLEQSGKDNNLLDKVQAVGAMPFHLGERMNRQVSLVATYLNEKQYLKSQNPDISEADLQRQAVENALKETQQTNGGSVLATAPSITQNSAGRIAMMYKTYGIQMYYTQMKAGLAALNKQGLSEEQRRVAKRQFIGTQLSVLAFSGMQGITFVGMALALTNALFLDDDEPDAETILRTYIGEGLYKGGVNELLATLGAEVDVASRIGLSNLILQTNRYNFDPSMEKTIVTTLGGPFYGYASSIKRGYDQMIDGEFQRGVESALPAAFRNMLKAGRFADEGALTKRKDPIMDDLGVGEIAGKFFGFQPAEYTLNQERNQILKKIEKSVNEKRSRIMKEFYIATRMGDSEGRREAMKELLKFNKKYPRVAIGTDSLMRSLKQHRETSINMYNGVTLSQRLRADLAEIGDAFDQGPQFFE